MAYLFIVLDGRGFEGAAFVVVLVVALATSITFTGGQCWLAWRLATYKHHRIKLSIAWVVILLGATVLGTVACLLRIPKMGGVEIVTNPEWLADHIPALVLAVAVAGLPEIMAAAVAVGHGDGVVVDEKVERQRAELTEQGSKLMEAEATARHAVDELKVMRKRAEDPEEMAKAVPSGVPLKTEKPASPNGNRPKSRKKIAGLRLLREGMGRSEVAKKVGVGRSTVRRWDEGAGP
jgi:DNA-binding NarL/FixJ family response regulator